MPLRLTARKPEIAEDQGDTLAHGLRRRRRELGLTRKQAARQLGVDYKTLMWWELDERRPVITLYPAIIAYLGYEPWPSPTTLAEALCAERRRHGLAVTQAAAKIGVDEGTWLRWERGEWKPTTSNLPRIDQFLGFSAREAFRQEVR